MEQSGLGTTILVDEIISDALQQLRSGDILPNESISLGPREPVARSTSVAHWGYRSYTDDVLKSFMDRPSVLNNTTNESSLRSSDKIQSDLPAASFSTTFNDSSRVADRPDHRPNRCSASFDNSMASNLFDEQHSKPQFDSSEEFVSGERLLDQFEADERQCQQENLFKGSHPVEAASLAASPEKVVLKQVQPPEWTKVSCRVDSESFFTADDRDSKHSLHSMKNLSITSPKNAFNPNASVTSSCQERKTLTASDFDCDLPYFLGVVLPGAVTHFNLSAPPCSSISIKSSLNGQSLNLCKVTRNPDQSSIRLSVETPPNTSGNIEITLEFGPELVVHLVALSILPVLAFPDTFLLVPNTPTRVNLRSMVKFSQPLQLMVQSTMPASKELHLTPDSSTASIELTANDTDTLLSMQLLNGTDRVASLQTSVEVRHPRISLRGEQSHDVVVLVIRNDERFPVDLALNDDLGGLTYPREVHVAERQSTQISVRRDSVRCSSATPMVTFSVELLAPVRVVLPMTKCRVSIPSTLIDLKPDLARFVWIAEKELVFTMANSQRSVNRKPTPWKSVVKISPCNFISDYVKVLEQPNDPTKVLLSVTRPPRLTVGTLRFFRLNETTPYGLRYPVLAPEKPSLLWHTASSNATSRVYQMPLDGKLRVSNEGRCAVFVMAVTDRSSGQGQIIPPGGSIQLTIVEPCRILYGLECWRCLVRYRTASHRAEIETHLRHTSNRSGLEPENLMGKFQGDSDESTVDKDAADKLPGDSQSLIRLYQLFMTTVEEVQVQKPEFETSTFFVRRS